MPYIRKEDREKFFPIVAEMRRVDICTPGELNYLISMICNSYAKDKPESYQVYNDILGALTGASYEFYRRKISPYEDKKIKENGDVF